MNSVRGNCGKARGRFSAATRFCEDIDFALADDLFGLYPTRREARAALRTLADAHRLCHKQLGLEEGARERPAPPTGRRTAAASASARKRRRCTAPAC
jgi:excinuclease Cho